MPRSSYNHATLSITMNSNLLPTDPAPVVGHSHEVSLPYQLFPIGDATLAMIDQAIANDQEGVLDCKFDLNLFKELLEEADDE